MPETEEKRRVLAAAAGRDELQQFLYDPSSRVVLSLLENKNLTAEEVAVVAGRRDIGAEVIQEIARNKRWSQSYPVRLALARNPRSPLSVSLSIARYLRIFDLEEITRSHFVPLVFRHKVEAIIVERIPAMPPGNKKTLAKKAAGKVLLALLQDRLPEIVRLCLDNPHMIEAHLYKVISRPATPPETILMISEHPAWSTRPLIGLALVRNAGTPLSVSVRFLNSMRLVDLRELYQDPTLPVAVRPLVYRELRARGEDPERGGNEVYEISEEDFASPDLETAGEHEEMPGRQEE